MQKITLSKKDIASMVLYTIAAICIYINGSTPNGNFNVLFVGMICLISALYLSIAELKYFKESKLSKAIIICGMLIVTLFIMLSF